MNNSYHLFVIYYAGHYAKYFIYIDYLILMTTHEQAIAVFPTLQNEKRHKKPIKL